MSQAFIVLTISSPAAWRRSSPNVIATPDHRDAIKQALSAHYFDVSRLETSTRTSATTKCVNSTRISWPIPENVSPSINQGC